MQPREHQRYNRRDGLTQPHKGTATSNQTRGTTEEGQLLRPIFQTKEQRTK